MKKGLDNMTKIDIISGFLGAGKTTLIKKLLDESFQGEKIVLIENEFGEIGIDGGFLRDHRYEFRLYLLLSGRGLWRGPETGAGGLLPRPYHNRALRRRKVVRRRRRGRAGPV